MYSKHVKIAHMVFKKDRGAQQSLGLAGRHKKTFSGWVEQALRFYGNLGRNQSYRDALAEFGLTQAKLDAAHAKVQNVLALNTAQEDEKGEAQQATLLPCSPATATLFPVPIDYTI